MTEPLPRVMRRLRAPAAVAASVLAAHVGTARAQVLESVLPNGVPGYDTSPGTTVLTRGHTGFEPVTIRLGGYEIIAGLDESVGYQNNVLGSVVAPQGSTVITTTPSVTVNRQWSNGSVYVSGSVSNNEYTNLQNESFTSDSIAAGVSHNFGNDTLTAGFAHIDADQLPAALNFISLTQPIPYQINTIRAQYQTQYGRFIIQPTVDYTTQTINNAFENNGYEQLTYLDSNTIDAALNVKYELVPHRDILLVAEVNDTAFPKTNPFGPNLGNVNVAGLVGYEENTGGIFNWFILAGFQNQTFNHSNTYATQSQPIAEGGVVYQPTGLTTLTLIGRNEIQDTTTPDQIGYTYQHLGFEIDHEYLRNVILTGNASVDRYVFDKTGSAGLSYNISAGVQWQVSRHLYLGFTVTDSIFNSSIANQLNFINVANQKLGGSNTTNATINDVTATVNMHIGL